MNGMLYEDWILAPSFVAWATGELTEGKSIGTYKVADLKLHGDVIQQAIDPNVLNTLRHKGAAQGRKAMKEVRARTESRLLKLIEAFHTDVLVGEEFKKSMTQVMRAAWYESFKAGIRAGGVPAKKIGGRTLPKLAEGDDKWFRSAMTHEMRFLNRFIKAIVENDYKMPLPQRVKMYVNSLNAFYESSRIVALPETTLIHWTGPRDKTTCDSCRYMFENSPFTKANLPTTPRAGLTRCLTNCRDKLMIRIVPPAQIEEAMANAPSRETHVSKLYKIKRGE